jgi:hypothetical protein
VRLDRQTDTTKLIVASLRDVANSPQNRVNPHTPLSFLSNYGSITQFGISEFTFGETGAVVEGIIKLCFQEKKIHPHLRGRGAEFY